MEVNTKKVTLLLLHASENNDGLWFRRVGRVWPSLLAGGLANSLMAGKEAASV